MLWLVPFVSALLGGVIAGWAGAVMGFSLGCVIAKILRNAGRSDSAPARANSVESGIRTLNPRAAQSETVDRLHERMGQLQASRTANENSQSSGVAFEPAPRTGRAAPKLTWYPTGASLFHAGLVIDAGMIFTSERTLAWPGEPSAIITSLSVAATAAHPLADFGYYPSYEQISAEQRRCYLEWLAAGRKDVDPAQRCLGYLFIFFYGLERRIILDCDRDPLLIEELIRLLQNYGPAHKSRSLRSYFLQLLHFAGWQLGADAYRALWPRLLEFDTDRPDEEGLRYVLANLYQRGEPLDWFVGCRLALADVESRRSTVIARANEKFFALFERRFNDQYGNGLRLEAAKQEALVQYRPASNALAQLMYEQRGQKAFQLRIPNVAGLHSQFKLLPSLWNSCVDDLSGYSRVLTSKKQGQVAALAAWQSLPRELRKIEDHPLYASFNELLANSPGEGDYKFMSVATLASLADITERAKLTTTNSRDVALLTESLGWRLAPDTRITGLPLAWNQELALYQVSPDQHATADVRGIIRLLYLAITVAAADGVIEAEEIASFYQIVGSQIAPEGDLHPVRATEASLRRDPNVALRSLPQLSKLIPVDSRQFVLRLLAHIAAADSEASLDELKVLRRIARAFQLEPDSAERLLREDEAFREVTVATAQRSAARGEAIPSRPTDKPQSFALNQERIKTLTEETHEVISLLSAVMADPEDAPCPPSVAAVTAQPSSAYLEWLSGLDARYHPAVLALVRHDAVTTNDFDCIAAENHLLPDDLFTAVNTWADEKLGDFLLERGENVRIFRNLIPDLAALPVAA
ncbi:MAG: TerB N-terminal domain-containing protein [Chthoniobacterales bacterium]